MSRRQWLLSLISLTVLISLLASGCTDNKGPSEPGRVLLGAEDKTYFDGYTSGFNSGASEGYGEASRGEAYSPSLRKSLKGGYRRSLGYWHGFNDGYNYGWKTAKNGYSRPEQPSMWYELAVAEAEKGGEQAVVGHQRGKIDEKEDAQMSGYNAGRREALADSKAGAAYSGDPSDSIIDSYCGDESEVYKEGWVVGYREGYREYYNIEAYRSGYKAGKAQALADSEAGRDFDGSPSDSTVDSHCSRESQDYEEIWIAGYKGGYDDYWSNLVEGSEYQAGYESGLKNGREWGRLDRESGSEYNDTWSQTTTGGSEEWERGYSDGYKKGYEEGYYGS